jgi:hypothetical protein
MNTFIFLVHSYLPTCPPILALVSAYLLLCFLAFWITRDRGFLVAFCTGGLFALPYFLH